MTRPQRLTAREDVVQHIKTLIFEGRLRHGDRVPQDEIAEELGVSRLPVREALIALERDSWVSMKIHRGAYVLGYDEATVQDVYEVFGLVYGLVARRAAERAAPEEIASLVVLQRAVTAARTPEAMLPANARFLEALRMCAGSPRVSSALRSVNGIVPGNFFAVVPRSIDIQRAGIAKVMKAVKAKDGDAAAETMLAMMRRHGGEVARILADRGVLG